MKLYSYYRSSAAYRVRIALNYKNIDYQLVPVNLLSEEHQQLNYKQKQPQGLVPCLEIDSGQFLSQSGAIIQYLEQLYPEQVLIPSDCFQGAKIQSFVDIIACDIHPICNLRILKYLTNNLDVNEEKKLSWYHRWITEGFSALESMLDESTYCFGKNITLADIYLIPQVYNAVRFNVDMSRFPKINATVAACNQLGSFIDAKPENQPDAK